MWWAFCCLPLGIITKATTYMDKTHKEKVWEKILSTGEEVKYEFSIGEKYIRTYLIVWAVICFPFVFMGGAGLFVYAFIFCYLKFYLPKANIYGFTNKRILVHTGWLSTNMTSVDYDKITDVYVKESFLDKLLTHTGQISINTAGSNGKEIVLSHINAPYEVKKKLDGLRGN
jgi:uncharacterized membrane protein YdbT with pleckstrin-like domain